MTALRASVSSLRARPISTCSSAALRLLAGALGIVASSLSIVGQASAQHASPAVELGIHLALDKLPLRDADGGRAVVRLLKTDDNRDVAIFGMILVRASRDAIVEHVLGLRGVVVTSPSQFGVFGDPPAGWDVRDVAFDRSEYKALRSCRPGDCDFKLSTPAMTSFHAEVDWSSPNAKQQADDVLRGQLLRLVSDYRDRGDSAMPTYDDRHGVQSANAFAAVLTQSTRILAEHAPALLRYLGTYPAGRPEGAHDFMYWSEERRSRMRPTLTLNHVVTYAPPGEDALIVRKQIYANHYLEAALEVIGVKDAGTPGAAYLITVRRFRFDHLPGGILNVRGRVRNSLVEATRSDLTRERTAIERSPVASQR